MKKIIVFLLISALWLPIFGQNEYELNCYRIHLSDKNDSPYSIDEPTAFLSPRAIDNRARFGIEITEEDLPVNPDYIEQILDVDENIKLLSVSKWANTVVVYCPNSLKINDLRALSPVDSVVAIANYEALLPSSASEEEAGKLLTASAAEAKQYDYGASQAQVAIHNGDKLHEAGFRGEGQLIAVIDCGWQGFDTLTHTAALFANGQIVGTRTLQPEDESVYNANAHGTNVTSIMALDHAGEMIGTAPAASYFFIESENVYSEQWIEEDFLAQAFEIADSLGADVVNVSLGYYFFDHNLPFEVTYDYSQQRSVSMRAANTATRKGLVVCVSAGNEGNGAWHHITAPATAEHVLTVAAVNADSVHAPFSSFGFGGDLVKPDVASVGWYTTILSPDDTIRKGNGTSFASPNLAGLAACLRQALPDKNAHELMQIIREAGHLYNNPNDSLGYGIPDFYKAYVDNTDAPISISAYENALSCSVFPNPTSDQVHITTNAPLHNVSVQLMDMQGKTILTQEMGSSNYRTSLSLQNVRSGIYFLQIKTANELIIKKIVKN